MPDSRNRPPDASPRGAQRGVSRSTLLGKTHLAVALITLTAEMGHRIYFTSAIGLARRMAKALAENHLSCEIKNLIRPRLLIIDEVGYLTLEAAHASLLFQVICERYEKQPAIVLTSNKAFADWNQAFGGDAIMASAAWTGCSTVLR